MDATIYEHDLPNKSLRPQYWTNRIIASMLGMVRPHFCEGLNVKGLENFLDEEGNPLPGPGLLVLKHESYADAVDLPPGYHLIPQKPVVKIMGRDNYTGVKPLDWTLNVPLSFYMDSIKRTSFEKIQDPQKRDWAQRKNEHSFAKMVDKGKKGKWLAVLPEGTTRLDGSIGKINAGVWNISHFWEGDQLYVFRTIPIGNTQDYYGGKDGKRQTFAVVGEPSHFQPFEGYNPQDPEHRKQAIHEFSYTIKEKFAQLHTYTITQFGAAALYSMIVRGSNSFNPMLLELETKRGIHTLRKLAPKAHIDESLLHEEGFQMRFSSLCDHLLEEGFLQREGYFSYRVVEENGLPRLFHIPDPKHFKKGNFPLYMFRRFASVAEFDEGTRLAFERTQWSLDQVIDEITQGMILSHHQTPNT
jgi:hypothetical protein